LPHSTERISRSVVYSGRRNGRIDVHFPADGAFFSIDSAEDRLTEKQRMLALIWLMMVVAYLDRVNISVAGPAIRADMHLSNTQFGWVLSAFQVGYALMQVPGGLLADRLGARALLVAAMVIWSGFTALTGIVRTLPTLIAVRVAFGFGEGVENGAQFKLIGDHFDSQERSSANGRFLSALAIGPALAVPLSTYLIGTIGWHNLFFACAVVGVVVAALLAANLPRHDNASAATARSVDRYRTSRPVGWGDLVVRASSWLTFGAYLFFNIGFWGFVLWMPSYLTATRHLTLANLGVTGMIPYVGGFVGLLAIGHLGSHALQRYRALLVAACHLSAAGCLYVAFSATQLNPCVAGLTAAAFFLYGGFGPFWAAALDLTPERLRGSFSGFINLGGQIGGIAAPIAVGRIVDVTRSYTGGFHFMMAALVLAAVCLAILQAIYKSATFQYPIGPPPSERTR
jgi:sugar phosphate permease